MTPGHHDKSLLSFIRITRTTTILRPAHTQPLQRQPTYRYIPQRTSPQQQKNVSSCSLCCLSSVLSLLLLTTITTTNTTTTAYPPYSQRELLHRGVILFVALTDCAELQPRRIEVTLPATATAASKEHPSIPFPPYKSSLFGNNKNHAVRCRSKPTPTLVENGSEIVRLVWEESNHSSGGGTSKTNHQHHPPSHDSDPCQNLIV